MIDFGVSDFGPEDDVEIFAWFPERENFDTEGSEEEVGVTEAVVGEAGEDEGEGNRGDDPPAREEGFVGAKGEGGDDDRDACGDGGGETELLSLGRAREADFLVGFGDFLGFRQHGESAEILFSVS